MHAPRTLSLFAALFAAFLSTAESQPLTNPRTMAEWEELDGVALVWFEEHYLQTWSLVEQYGWTLPLQAEYDALIGGQTMLVQAILDEGILAYVVDYTGNDYVVEDTLAARGVTSPNLRILDREVADGALDFWIRDHGPFSVYENDAESLNLVGWQENYSTAFLASGVGAPHVQLAEGTGEFCDGGNHLTDGHGLFVGDDKRGSSVPLQPTFASAFGMDRFVDLPAYRIHIDYYMKLINEETLFVSEIPASNYIGLEQWFDDEEKLDAAIATLQANAVSCYGRPFEIVRLRNAPSFDSLPLNLTYMTVDASYVNSLILNRTVIVPTYDHPETDGPALAAYAEHMPGYRIVPIPSRYLAMMGGATHCITRDIGAAEPVFISHAWFPDSLDQTTDYIVEATIRTASGVADAAVWWTTDPGTGYEAVAMAAQENDRFEGIIPGQPYGTAVSYYIEAHAVSGRTGRKPFVAPDGVYEFLVDPNGYNVDVDESPPGAIALRLGRAWPNPFTDGTAFRVTVPGVEPAVLQVFDVAGRLVRELAAPGPTGARVVSWDGRNGRGERVAPGHYFVRLATGTDATTRRVVSTR